MCAHKRSVLMISFFLKTSRLVVKFGRFESVFCKNMQNSLLSLKKTKFIQRTIAFEWKQV